jgi:hypothetical protein
MDWTKVVEIAVAVVGIIEWFKGLFKKAPTWVWAVAAVVGCLGMSAVAFYLPPFVLFGIVVLAVVTLGYELLVQLPKQLIQSKIPSAPVG